MASAVEILKGEKNREKTVTRFLASIAGAAGTGEVDTIVLDESGGKRSSVKVTTDRNGKPVVIDAEEYELLYRNPTPEKVLSFIASDAAIEESLRAHAIRALGSRGATRAVSRLIGLLNTTSGALIPEIAGTLSRLTGRNFGPDGNSTLDEAQRALSMWKSWWEANKDNNEFSFSE